MELKTFKDWKFEDSYFPQARDFVEMVSIVLNSPITEATLRKEIQASGKLVWQKNQVELQGEDGPFMADRGYVTDEAYLLALDEIGTNLVRVHYKIKYESGQRLTFPTDLYDRSVLEIWYKESPKE